MEAAAKASDSKEAKSSTNEKLGELDKGSNPGRKTKGKSTQKEKTGGREAADKDFKDLGLSDIKESGDTKIGTLPDGSKVNIRTRPDKKSGRKQTTIEVQKPGGKKIKYRYYD